MDPKQRAEFKRIMAKPVKDYTDAEFRFVKKCMVGHGVECIDVISECLKELREETLRLATASQQLTPSNRKVAPI